MIMPDKTYIIRHNNVSPRYSYRVEYTDGELKTDMFKSQEAQRTFINKLEALGYTEYKPILKITLEYDGNGVIMEINNPIIENYGTGLINKVATEIDSILLPK